MKKTNKGFTLIELIVVVSLLSIAVGLTGDTLITIIRSFNKTTVKNEIEQSANFVSQKLIKELRNAQAVTQLDPADPTPLQQGDYHNELTFTDADDNQITYSIISGIVYRDGGSGDEALTENNPPYGVNVTCGSGNACFTMVESSPQVIRISINMSQSGSPASKLFEGSISIEDTIVIRDTY